MWDEDVLTQARSAKMDERMSLVSLLLEAVFLQMERCTLRHDALRLIVAALKAQRGTLDVPGDALTARDAGCENWSRTVTVAVSAFDHTAALLWLEKADVSGHVVARLGLPVARDKILAGDAKFGAILRVPVLFFTQPMPYFDQLARDAFRLDFSARMALARLEASAGLSPADRQWYCAVLVQYFDRAPQFMPCPPQQAYAELFRFLCRTDLLTASDVSTLLRMAGALALPAELISEMMEVRTRRFETVTGFEDLELD